LAPLTGDMKQFLLLILTQFCRFATVSFRDRIATIIGILWYFVAEERREIVRENIETIKGDAKENEVKATFINFIKVYSDIVNIPNMTKSYLNSMIKESGVHFFRSELDKGKGVILVSSHLGGMELAGPYLSSLGLPLFSVAESKGPGMKFFRFYNRYREHLGSSILRLENNKLAFTLVRLLKENKIVVLVADRDIKNSGVEHKFFGRTVSIPRGVTLLSKRMGAPLVVGYMVLDSMTPRYQVRIFNPIYPQDYNSEEELMDALIKLLEEEISMFTDQWFVFQRIWKD
jgi:lauroyl/myristoyl acyltransferase